VAGRAYGIKMAAVIEVEVPVSLDEETSNQIVGASAFVIFLLHLKTQKMVCRNMIVATQWVPLHACINRRW